MRAACCAVIWPDREICPNPMAGCWTIAMPGAAAMGIMAVGIIMAGAAAMGIMAAVVATGIVIVISAGRGIATIRMMGNGIRMVSNMNAIPVRSRTWVVTGAIMPGLKPAMGIMPGIIIGAVGAACIGA